MHHDWIESAWAAHSAICGPTRGYCGNVEQAEDAVQDAFLKLQQTTPAVAGIHPALAVRVVRNRLIDLHRRCSESGNDILPALAVDADDSPSTPRPSQP